MTSKALCSFGLIADVQYADVEDGYNFTKTRQRFYRKSLKLLEEAIVKWRQCDVDFVIQLGDLIDGHCKRYNGSHKALDLVMNVFNSLQKPVYHVFGNHEFYNFSRTWLKSSPLWSSTRDECSSPKDRAYYSLIIHKQLKIVVLDFYEISILGADEGGPEYHQAYKTLTEKNKNKDLNAPQGLHGLDKRFVKFNGACSIPQIEWLKMQLSESINKKQNVIVIGHLPICEASSNAHNLCWNYGEVVSVLHDCLSCVLCYIAGHDHDGGNATDDRGLLHITMPGVIEADDTNPFAITYLHQDKLVIKGEGTMPSYDINLKYPMLSS